MATSLLLAVCAWQTSVARLLLAEVGSSRCSLLLGSSVLYLIGYCALTVLQRTALLALVYAYGEDAKESYHAYQRPSGFLKKIGGLRGTHHLIATCKIGCQTTTLTVLNQHQQNQQDGCNNN